MQAPYWWTNGEWYWDRILDTAIKILKENETVQAKETANALDALKDNLKRTWGKAGQG
jgi:hypothetical protein